MKQFSNKEDSAYDLSSYENRVKHFKKLTNPLNWFISNKKLKEYYDMINNFDGTNQKYKNDELWNAKYALLGNYHPQNNAPINKLFRSSGFVIVNAPIAFIMSVMPPTFPNQMIGQILNQTYNYLFNFYNQNSSNEYSFYQMGLSYSLAVGFSLVGALGTLALVDRLHVKPLTKTILKRLSPFVGIGTANVANLFFSRYQDFSNGIQVIDPQTNQTVKGHNSLIASKMGFYQTAITRLTIPIPIVIFPSLIMHILESAKLVPKSGVMQIVAGNLVALCCLYLAFTYSLALFPQMVRISADKLEPEFHNLKREDGTIIKEFLFNKGL